MGWDGVVVCARAGGGGGGGPFDAPIKRGGTPRYPIAVRPIGASPLISLAVTPSRCSGRRTMAIRFVTPQKCRLTNLGATDQAQPGARPLQRAPRRTHRRGMLASMRPPMWGGRRSALLSRRLLKNTL